MSINKTKLIAVLALALTLQAIPNSHAKPKMKDPITISYGILHAIPAGFGADVVDVYANGSLVIDNATPGAYKSLTTQRGNVTVAIYANGVVPGATTTALLTAGPIYVSHSMNPTFVAHLTAAEKPSLAIYRNMITGAGSKRAWLTIRHVAAAPEVKLKINSDSLFIPLANGYERKRSLKYGNYSVGAFYVDSPTVTVAPINVMMQSETNVVLYIWGARSKANVSFFKQEIPVK